jgi:hypothetical protein
MPIRSTDRGPFKGFGLNKILDGRSMIFYDTNRTGGGTNSPTYSVSPSTTSINEGSSVTFTVSTNVPSGTTLYWSTNAISGTINGSDFNDGVTTGSFIVTNDTGSFSRTLANDATTEGSESFQIQIRTGSASGPIVATSSTITIGDTSLTPTYSVSPSTSSVNEGSSVTFTVTTTDVPNGTTLYWSTNTISGTVNSSDFNDGSTTGSFTISGNSGSIVRTLTSDFTTEGSESFQLQIRTGSTAGTIVATSSTVTVNDTSTTPPLVVEYLVVAGGGGGGGVLAAGGGGGGGYRTASSVPLNISTNYTVTIGAGGNGGGGSGPPAPASQPGNPSTFDTITSTGGGRGSGFGVSGGTSSNEATSGGSGGGGSAGYYPGGSGTPGQGFSGGNSSYPTPDNRYGGAGGGGAGEAGAPLITGTPGGRGGNGLLFPTTGQYYAGGGGGSGRGASTTFGASGGTGGGGAGGGASAGNNGTSNTGGGGGGSGDANQNYTPSSRGGNGGSGIVILKYPQYHTISNPGGGLTYSTSPSGSDRITQIFAGTGNVSWS